MCKRRLFNWCALLIFLLPVPCIQIHGGESGSLPVLVGIDRIPHASVQNMKFRKESPVSTGGRIVLFFSMPTESRQSFAWSAPRFQGKTAGDRLRDGSWTWHNTPDAFPENSRTQPAGSLAVWTINETHPGWRPDGAFVLQNSDPIASWRVQVADQPYQIRCATFTSDQAGQIRPNRLNLHIKNNGLAEIRLQQARIHLPEEPSAYHWLKAGEWLAPSTSLPSDGSIPAGEQGVFTFQTGELPLTYCAIEVLVLEKNRPVPQTLWAYLKIKKETFDISGGWIADVVNGRQTLTMERYLQTLKRLHVNTGHIGEVSGYTDQTHPDGLYTKYPVKLFNKLQDTDRYAHEDWIGRIHAIEFLGEPQLEWGRTRKKSPQLVFELLQPYAPTPFSTTVTLSDASFWNEYAGLSDYPHYDAYRVTAPMADRWSAYDRWKGKRIRWGAPLETIGDMTISLRDTSRPATVAYWSQGPHAGWSGMAGRRRASPNADELRMQAYHALASHITSLYWFNLSLESLAKFPDTLEPMKRIGREIRMMEDWMIQGSAYQTRVRTYKHGLPDWDLSGLVSPRGMLCFALDLNYEPNDDSKEFIFGPDRPCRFSFELPAWLEKPAEVFRLDADGTFDVKHEITDGRLIVSDQISRTAVYAVAIHAGLRKTMEARRAELVIREDTHGFKPDVDSEDQKALVNLLGDL